MQKKPTFISLVSLCLIVCLCLAGCGSTAAPQDAEQQPTNDDNAYTFTDALGQEITVNQPQRVVALMGSFAEIWLLAGGGDTLSALPTMPLTAVTWIWLTILQWWANSRRPIQKKFWRSIPIWCFYLPKPPAPTATLP